MLTSKKDSEQYSWTVELDHETTVCYFCVESSWHHMVMAQWHSGACVKNSPSDLLLANNAVFIMQMHIPWMPELFRTTWASYWDCL